MNQETRVVMERWRGTRGGSYFYVVEGSELVHIEEYALRTSYPAEDEVAYEVPMDRLRGKTLYWFSFSNTGGSFLARCRIEDFEGGYPKNCEYYELLERGIHEIRNLKFRIKDPTLSSLLTEFSQTFIPMINEIKEYERKQGFNIEEWESTLLLPHNMRLLSLHTLTMLIVKPGSSEV